MLCESKGNLESSFELTYRTKRQLTLIGFTLRRFAAGLDYMIILPSLWFYLQTFQSWYFMLGLVIAADSFVAFFLSHWIVLLTERWRKVRFLGFLANIFHIGGSMVYALSLYYYLPLVGRLVSGIGLSFDGALYSEVKRITSPEERNRVLIIMEGVRLFGILIGPGMNFFLRSFNLTIGPWIIDKYTAPGFFMVLVWALVQVVHMFTVYDLDDDPEAYRELPADDTPHRRSPRKMHDQGRPLFTEPFSVHSDRDAEDGPRVDDGGQVVERKMESGDKIVQSDDKNLDSDSEDRIVDKGSQGDFREETGDSDKKDGHDSEKKYGEFSSSVESDGDGNVEDKAEDEENRGGTPPPRPSGIEEKPSISKMLARRDVILILITQFLMFFNQTAFETLILLVGTEKLDFNIPILSAVFILAGVEMIVVIIFVWSANKAMDAKYLLMAALSSGILASFARLAINFTIPHHAGCWSMTLLMGAFTIIGTPLASISGKSLLPKITHPDHHAFYQSAFATSQHLGLVTGPLVASALYGHLVAFSSVMVVVFLAVYMFSMNVIEKLAVPAYGCGK